MKFVRGIGKSFGAIGLVVAIATSAWAADNAFVSLSDLASSISQAKTPSAAVAAYANASAKAGDKDLTLENAFIVRMVELGAPDMAENQAQDLSGRSDSGLPWAVLAFNSATKNQLEPAIDQISHAVNASPSNEFVGRTAGQILAWYDAQPTDAKISDATRKTAEDIRKDCSSRRSFADAYDQAHGELEPVADNSGRTVLVDGNVSALSIFNSPGTSGRYASSPLAMFYAAPYVLLPNYGFAYQPWGPQVYASGAFARLGDRVPFPTPTVGIDQRYIRTPTPSNGFILLGEDGDISYFPAYYPPIYAGYYGGGIAYPGGVFISGPAFGGAALGGRAFGGGRLHGFVPGFRGRMVSPGLRPGNGFAVPGSAFQPVTTPFQAFPGGARPGLPGRMR